MKQDNYVLYIEDDEDDIYVFEESFKDISSLAVHHLQDAGNLQSFLSTQNGSEPCLFVIDMNLVKYTGLEVLQQIRQNETYSHLPVVMLSTSASSADRNACEKLNAQVLTKPGTFAEWQQITKNLHSLCMNGSNAV